VLFLEARLEVVSHASARIVLDNQLLPGFVYLKRAGNNGSGWLPPAEAAVRSPHRYEVMCPAVSGERFSPTENVGYSA
jgi:hypothetical protein